ncbi:MAG: hypothetical protein ACOCUI_04205 [bacterium]
MTRKEKFLKKLKNKYGDEYSLIGEYTAMKSKTDFKHNKCGTTITKAPVQILLNKNNCYICDEQIEMNHSQFLNKIKYYLPKIYEEYEVKGKYKGTKTPIAFIHKKCGFEFDKTPETFLNGKKRCPVCDGTNALRTNEIFQLQVKQAVNDEYFFQDDYIDSYIELECIHKKCGTKFNVSPTSFLNSGTRCPKCTKEKIKNLYKKGMKKFKEEVKESVENEYSVVSNKYINTDTTVTFRHNSEECDFHEFETTPYRFLSQNVRCPICTRGPKSKAMIKIENVLDKEKINYRKEYKFKDLSFERELRFDYAIFNQKEELLFILEYDGEQHFRPIKHFGSIDRFIGLSIKDSLKNAYCNKNNIDLIRISFEDKKILKNKLYNLLKKYGLLKKENRIA